jgi:hypothetical protein
MGTLRSSDAPIPATRRAGWWRRQPALWALLAALAFIVAAFVPTLWQMRLALDGARPTAPRDAPWEADITADGSQRALGLRLPGATLGDAQALWANGLQVVLRVSAPDDVRLEATVENARPGGVVGRLVLQVQARPEQLQRWRARPAREDAVNARVRLLTLQPDDRGEALNAPLRMVGFIPQGQLDEAVVRSRFGEPQRVVRESATVQHWLYPARGLAVMLDTEGRDLLRFVPPADFAGLVETPLQRALAGR